MVAGVSYARFRDRFAAMLDPRFYTPDWLDEQIRSGEFMVFTGDKSAILTTIKVYPTGAKAIHGMAAVGELREIISVLIPLAENHARSLGCITAEIESREGWARVMSEQGYHVYQTMLRKDL